MLVSIRMNETISSIALRIGVFEIDEDDEAIGTSQAPFECLVLSSSAYNRLPCGRVRFSRSNVYMQNRYLSVQRFVQAIGPGPCHASLPRRRACLDQCRDQLHSV